MTFKKVKPLQYPLARPIAKMLIETKHLNAVPVIQLDSTWLDYDEAIALRDWLTLALGDQTEIRGRK